MVDHFIIGIRITMKKIKVKIKQLQDTSPMPDNGKYKGVPMTNIPAYHLLWLYDNNKCSPMVRRYIIDNLDDLEDEK